MLASFIGANRDAIVARARARVAARMSPKPTEFELSSGIPTFVEQLREALQIAESSDVLDHTAINASAERHGGEMMKRGLTIGQVVHDYGDVCQTVTSLVVELAAPITGEEFRTLNLCLDDAIAGAVTEFSRLQEQASKDRGTERLGILAHEMRNLLSTAILSFDIIKSGQVGATGSTATVHRRSLLGLRDLIDRSLADVRLEAGVQHPELIHVDELFAEIEIGAHIQAEGRAIRLTIGDVEGGLKIFGDRQILAAAISNLLQNAFKFSKRNGHVSLTVRQTAERVFIEVEDECGGLPPGKAEDLFRPYEQRGTDLTGVGLGLSIVSKAAKASSGSVSVRNLPGKGCVFTLELPRLP